MIITKIIYLKPCPTCKPSGAFPSVKWMGKTQVNDSCLQTDILSYSICRLIIWMLQQYSYRLESHPKAIPKRFQMMDQIHSSSLNLQEFKAQGVPLVFTIETDVCCVLFGDTVLVVICWNLEVFVIFNLGPAPFKSFQWGVQRNAEAEYSKAYSVGSSVLCFQKYGMIQLIQSCGFVVCFFWNPFLDIWEICGKAVLRSCCCCCIPALSNWIVDLLVLLWFGANSEWYATTALIVLNLWSEIIQTDPSFSSCKSSSYSLYILRKSCEHLWISRSLIFKNSSERSQPSPKSSKQRKAQRNHGALQV